MITESDSTFGQVAVRKDSPLSPVQPCSPVAVRQALRDRHPTPHYTTASEPSLFATLPLNVKADLRLLLGTRPGAGAFGHITHLVNSGSSVQSACATTRSLYKIPGSLKRLRARYDLWTKTGDWVSLVNRSKAGAEWQLREDGLPLEFLQYCAARFGKYTRDDGKRQALLAIKRQWTTGRNSDGDRAPIPGYGYKDSCFGGRPSDFPTGWSYTNILAQLKSKNLFSAAVRASMHHSTAAARSYIPQVRFDRSHLLFMQEVQFDDVKTDFLIIDPESGQVCDLWLLVARDLATSILLGFGMRPARTREDGTQEHLRLRDMKQLFGWLLERYGLPPYEVICKIEHGTATFTLGTVAALRELLPDRIDISYSSMIGGTSPSGYRQRAIGNSKGKASLESHNRLMHTMLADRPGQTGPLYTKRPSDLAARSKEADQIFACAQHLPEHLRGQVGYPLLTLNQAREHLHRIFRLQNERTEHNLQGFEEVAEWFNADSGLWLPQTSFPSVSPGLSGSIPVRVRKESPLERCARLVAPYRNQWTQVSPDIITAFYEHTARQVTVKDNGHIEFTTDGRPIEFIPAPDAPEQVPGTKLLAYFHPDSPDYLHLTDGQGRVVGTWLRRTRASDEETIKQAIRYSAAALRTVTETAAAYAAPERERLDAMRAHNAELLQANTFIEVASPVAVRKDPVKSGVSSSLSAIRDERARTKQAERDYTHDAEDSRDILMKSML